MSDFSISPRPSSELTITGQIERNREDDAMSERSDTRTLRNESSSLDTGYHFAHPYSDEIVRLGIGTSAAMGFMLINLVIEAVSKGKEAVFLPYIIILALLSLVDLGLYVIFNQLETRARVEQ